MEKFLFELVSPEKHLLKEKVEMAVLPGESGDFGVLAHHSALISILRPGLLTLYEEDKPKHYIFVSGGVAHVTEEACTVLAEECIFVQDIKREDLESYIQKTQAELAIARSEEERSSLEKDLQMARVKAKIMKKLKGSGL